MGKKYTIYGSHSDEPTIYTIAQVVGDNADKIIDILFDTQVWTDYEIFYDTIWAGGEDNE